MPDENEITTVAVHTRLHAIEKIQIKCNRDGCSLGLLEDYPDSKRYFAEKKCDWCDENGMLEVWVEIDAGIEHSAQDEFPILGIFSTSHNGFRHSGNSFEEADKKLFDYLIDQFKENPGKDIPGIRRYDP